MKLIALKLKNRTKKPISPYTYKPTAQEVAKSPWRHHGLKLWLTMKDVSGGKKNVILQKILFKVWEASSLHLGSTGHLMGMTFEVYNFPISYCPWVP